MKEIEDIIKAYDEAVKVNKKTALATVVHVDGSSYRRPGARMLITEDGMLTGAISGGCLEGDALRKALLVIMRQQSMLVTYDTNDEEDAMMGMGLGCNGIIQVLIEPVDAGKINNPISLLKIVANNKRQVSLVTLFSLSNKRDPQTGTCLLLDEYETIMGDTILLKHLLIAGAKDALRNQQSSFHNYSTGEYQFTAFTEFIPLKISLVVIGAGNDTIPLINMAELLGWETTIVDGRPAFAKKERFPATCSVILSKPEQVVGQVKITNRTAFVLMTHNYNYDLAMLQVLAERNIIYTGMLGPRKKLDRMLDEMRSEGMALTAAQLSRIYSPVGLDIGAETAEEIALSIAAEIKAVFSLAKAIPLKDNAAPIHDRGALTIKQMDLS